MTDLSHQFGSDLTLSATGDLATVDGSDAALQRILRRLLSNPRSYVWHTDYGAGLGRFVGQPFRPQRIQAVILSQMRREPAVAQDPPPTVVVTGQPNGTTVATISYTDAITGEPQTVPVPLSV